MNKKSDTGTYKSSLLLQLGGYLNIIIAIGHLIGLIWAEPFFNVTGIGKEMKEMSLIHFSIPYLITVLVTIFFAAFGLYGLSAANKFRKLPYIKVAIYSIAAIYIVRGLSQLFTDSLIEGEGIVLGTIYSIVAFAIGLLYLIGGFYKWKKINSSN